jgi:hypothetical protein
MAKHLVSKSNVWESKHTHYIHMHCWPHFELVSPCGTGDEETIQVLDNTFPVPNLIKGTKLGSGSE